MPRSETTSYRRAMLAKVHLGKKELGLDDDTYRALLNRVTRKDSAAKCSDAQLQHVIEAMRRQGFKPKSGKRREVTASPQAMKIRALWQALYELGAIKSASESSLNVFVLRQAKIESLRWLSADKANSVIEALRAMCKRAGFDAPRTDGDADEAKRMLAGALWANLHELGAVRIGHPNALDTWSSHKFLGCKGNLRQLAPIQLDECVQELGRWLRREQRKELAG